jgi:hypothetical protein
MFFFYRKDLFDAAGLKPPATMDEWIAAARTLTKPDRKQYGTAMTLKAGDGFQNDFTYYLRTYGGDWYDKDWKVTMDSEAGVKALTTMKELMKYVPPNVLAFHNDETTVAMQQGLTATGSARRDSHPRLSRGPVFRPIDRRVANHVETDLPAPMKDPRVDRAGIRRLPAGSKHASVRVSCSRRADPTKSTATRRILETRPSPCPFRCLRDAVVQPPSRSLAHPPGS